MTAAPFRPVSVTVGKRDILNDDMDSRYAASGRGLYSVLYLLLHRQGNIGNPIPILYDKAHRQFNLPAVDNCVYTLSQAGPPDFRAAVSAIDAPREATPPTAAAVWEASTEMARCEICTLPNAFVSVVSMMTTIDKIHKKR